MSTGGCRWFHRQFWALLLDWGFFLLCLVLESNSFNHPLKCSLSHHSHPTSCWPRQSSLLSLSSKCEPVSSIFDSPPPLSHYPSAPEQACCLTLWLTICLSTPPFFFVVLLLIQSDQMGGKGKMGGVKPVQGHKQRTDKYKRHGHPCRKEK